MTDKTSDDAIRLSKVLCSVHSLSRSEAESFIENGFVSVNGSVVELPQHRVKASDSVVLSPDAKAMPTLPMTILWHKPAGVPADMAPALLLQHITPASRASIDRSGIRFLRKHVREQVCVTPLETGASGLVIYTQDFPVKRKLVQDTLLVEHEIMVDVLHSSDPDEEKAAPSNAKLDESLRMLSRMVGHKTKMALSKQTDTLAGLRFAAKGFEPGVIADQCQRAGLAVEDMRRIRIGRIPLAGLPLAQWRFLMGYERF